MTRAERVLRQHGMQRIERIGSSTFADSSDKKYQLVVRCIAEKQIIVFAAAGPDEGTASGMINKLKQSFESLQ